jgi:hypothetical protein
VTSSIEKIPSLYNSDINLGCKYRVASGLDWVFKNVDDAIILEDDCFPSINFFRFCDELLDYYRSDTRVGMIGGTNFQYGYKVDNNSYYFSKNFHIWGWATWKDRWLNCYDVEMNKWCNIKQEKRINDISRNNEEAIYLSHLFDSFFKYKIDTWDYQWTFTNLINSRLAVVPNHNLVSNIGFGPSATHTTSRNITSDMPVEEITFPLTHPQHVVVSNHLDQRYFKTFNKVSYFRKIKYYFEKINE